MKSKKFLILAITISFPVILYLFLRFFGQNEYHLPYFFQKEGIACKDIVVEEPLWLIELTDSQDSIALQSLFNNSISLVLFPSTEKDIHSLKNELNRTVQNLSDQLDLRIIAFYKTDSKAVDILNLKDVVVENYGVLTNRYNDLVSCYFKLPTKNYNEQHPMEEEWPANETITLIDDQNQIRGYYNGFETKDVDRLILEINVLLIKK